MRHVTNKKKIRKYIRSLRQSLTFSEQYVAAQLITNKIINLHYVDQAKNIAIFISTDGEVSTNLLIKTLLLMNKSIYLPILPNIYTQSIQYLSFVKYTLSTPLVRNRFNIYEPKYNNNNIHIIPMELLDILFIPLVAFDQNKNRLGMGGGFYDKTLQHWEKKIKNCICIGLAYNFQKIPNHLLPIEQWDIKLSNIITPSCLY
ncbi:5-formyltetrahydrofolate cyclo-ligase [Candidatus Blochmanniella vafra str. BVAF]|uniref:5-formyltetrahydrofolate cyclo-ligase n=1 Tax=Blochmanniella vafra (strain BVAF) TaxID=859654 RepID=E8Q641_BLOVB|nr:5-formyltetrahydrofolate cyclo-ligase [Candidatus Blochmannia vafer]ADV33657.1 5-formyltetrahydrofolate cyclo-ligase [Candidatus Blochmannia vafer str. BVAF]